jgi:hypothetical protein
VSFVHVQSLCVHTRVVLAMYVITRVRAYVLFAGAWPAAAECLSLSLSLSLSLCVCVYVFVCFD